MSAEQKKLVIISGPTATGKSELAIGLALRFKSQGITAEVINADSAQVYRFMDIGTDKLSLEERKGVAHHLIDVVNPDEHFDAMIFRNLALKQIEKIHQKNGIPILVGGTGFWLKVLIYGLFPGPARSQEIRQSLEKIASEKGSEILHQQLQKIDPVSAQRIHPRDAHRIIRALEVFELTAKPLSAHFQNQAQKTGFQILYLALNLDRNLLYEKINHRVEQMLKKGFLEEVKKLREMGYGALLPSQKIIGYRQLHEHLEGKLTLEKAAHEVKKQTRHYARRQLIWLRAEPMVNWIDPIQEKDKIFDLAEKFYRKKKND